MKKFNKKILAGLAIGGAVFFGVGNISPTFAGSGLDISQFGIKLLFCIFIANLLAFLVMMASFQKQKTVFIFEISPQFFIVQIS